MDIHTFALAQIRAEVDEPIDYDDYGRRLVGVLGRVTGVAEHVAATERTCADRTEQLAEILLALVAVHRETVYDLRVRADNGRIKSRHIPVPS